MLSNINLLWIYEVVIIYDDIDVNILILFFENYFVKIDRPLKSMN